MADSVTLPFEDGEYEVRPKHVFRTARAVEDVITVTEIAILSQKGAIPYARIASAYTLALKKAGATADEESVFEWLYGGGEGIEQNVFLAMEKLAEILVPASARKLSPGATEVPLEPAKVKESKKTKPSSNQPTN